MLSLPQELIDNVVRFVDCTFTLAAFARCSRRSNETVTPLLYRHVAIACQNDPQKFSSRLKSTTIHLLSHPQLAAAVEELILHYPPKYTTSPDCGEATTLGDFFETALQDVQRPHLSRTRDLELAKLGPPHDEFFVALLSLSLPNLRNVCAFPPRMISEAYCHAMGYAIYRQHANRHSPFKPIDTLALNGRDWEVPIPISGSEEDVQNVTEPIIVHIVLPHIHSFQPRRLILLELDSGRFQPYSTRLPPYSGRIAVTMRKEERIQLALRRMRHITEYVEIRGTSLALNHYACLFETLEGLNTVIYEHSPRSDFYGAEFPFLLRPFSESLTHLSLDTWDADQQESAFCGNPFKYLSGLKHLEIALTYLVSHNREIEPGENDLYRLPRGLTHLGILRADYPLVPVEEIVEAIISRSKDFPPSLRELGVEGRLEKETVLKLAQLSEMKSMDSSVMQLRVIVPSPTLLPGVLLADRRPFEPWEPGSYEHHATAWSTAPRKRGILVDLAEVYRHSQDSD